MSGASDSYSMRHSSEDVHIHFKVAPWTARSPKELLRNILTQPLKFPLDKNPCSAETQDLIMGCLQPDESKRLSWEEIYRHPAVSLYFQVSLVLMPLGCSQEQLKDIGG